MLVSLGSMKREKGVRDAESLLANGRADPALLAQPAHVAQIAIAQAGRIQGTAVPVVPDVPDARRG